MKHTMNIEGVECVEVRLKFANMGFEMEHIHDDDGNSPQFNYVDCWMPVEHVRTFQLAKMTRNQPRVHHAYGKTRIQPRIVLTLEGLFKEYSR